MSPDEGRETTQSTQTHVNYDHLLQYQLISTQVAATLFRKLR